MSRSPGGVDLPQCCQARLHDVLWRREATGYLQTAQVDWQAATLGAQATTHACGLVPSTWSQAYQHTNVFALVHCLHSGVARFGRGPCSPKQGRFAVISVPAAMAEWAEQ